MRRSGHSRFLTAVALGLWAGMMIPRVSSAIVGGSPHDFSATGPFTQSSAIAPSGACSACHIPHNAYSLRLWPRDLSDYGSNLRNNGSNSPNYLLPVTIPCYDCHDFHGVGGINNVPRDTDFNAQHQPQNIAFGFRKNSTGNMMEDGPGTTSLNIPGYYENKPPFSSSYGADPSLSPTGAPYPTDNTNLLKTGGHYFKTKDPTGSSGDNVDIGDKLPCRDCHDPHAWASNWQAFIKPNLGGATGWSRVSPSGRPTASRYMANDFTTSGARDDSASRTLCIACHGDSNAYPPVDFREISAAYSSSAGAIVRPPDTIAEHRNASAIACVSCHGHNKVDATCSDCHGNPAPSYPPNLNPESGTLYDYPGGSPGREQTHARHNGFLSDNLARFSSYSFKCTVCHAGQALHQDSNVTVAYDLSSLGKGNPPSFQPFTGSTYVRSTCANVYCHSLGLSDNTVNPLVLPATTVTYFRTVTWGTSPLGCNGCHGTTTVSGTPQFGMPEHESGEAGSASANSHAAHVVNNGYECSICHFNTAAGTYQTARAIRGAGTPPVANAYHVNGIGDVAFDGTNAIGAADGEGGYHHDNNQTANKRCNVSCHGTGKPLLARPQWGGTLNCDSCHASQGINSGTNTGAHSIHTDNTSYRFACEQCHARRATDGNTTHARGDGDNTSLAYAEVRFTDNEAGTWAYDNSANVYKTYNLRAGRYGQTAPGPAYQGSNNAGAGSPDGSIPWSIGTCSNVWCHSNANPADAGGGANTYRTPAWDNATPVTCVSCHLGPDTMGNMLYNPPTPDRMSQGHAFHASTDSYAYRCDECHANTVPNDCTTRILDPGGLAYHVNGNKADIQGSSSVKVSTTINNAMTYNDNTHICSNVYCHSNGLRQSPPFVARNSGQTAQLAWNLPPTTACGSANPCHASNLGQASTNFATVNDNTAHRKHSYNCFACHITTQQYDSYDYNRLHVNGVKDVTISSDSNNYDNDTIPNNNYELPTKTCSGIACHGGRPVSWTDNNLSCSACHTTVNNVDVTSNSYDYTFTLGTPNMSKISPANYANRGHGRNGALPWGSGKNPAALFGRPIACLDCHDNSQFHTTALFGTNPFRFRATINGRSVAFDNVDTVCYACHDGAAVKVHASAVTGGGSSGWVHNQKCVDCHDVHGQANIFMVYDNIVWQDNTTAAYATSNGYGVPYYPASRAPVAFAANASGADYASTNGAAPYDGICEVCHERTAQYQRTGTLVGPQGHSQDKCTGCHRHLRGFKASCNDCHGEASGAGAKGSPPYAPSLGNHPWPSQATVDNLSSLAGVGDHRTATGVSYSSHGTFGCGLCHTSTPGSDSLHDNTTKVNASMDNIASHTWNGAGGPLASSWSAGPLAGAPLGGSVVDDSCSNIDCHSPYYGGNSFRSGTPFPYTRYWINSTLWDCYTCHAYDGFKATNRPGGTNNVIGTGSHSVHLGTAGPTPLRQNVSCAACHVDPGENVAHKDGSVQVPITGTVGGVTLGGSYTTSPAMPQPPTDNAAGHRAWGTCTTVYCHSTVQKNNPDGLPNDNVTYVPTPQWGSAGGVVCGSCHKAGMDVHASAGWDNIATGSHAAHVGIMMSKFGGIMRCNACHQYAGKTSCSGCHSPHGGSTEKTPHSDGYIDIGFSGMLGTVSLSGGQFDNNADGSPDNTIIPGMPYGTCRSLYCHGTGTPVLTGGANQAATPNIPRWGDSATSLCGSCHGGPGGATNYPGRGSNYPANGFHVRHMSATDNVGPHISACSDCHTASTAASHVNGLVDFRMSSTDATPTTLDNTATCDPCHGTGGPAAKSQWDNAAYLLNCLTCHSASPASTFANGTGRVAPNVGGDSGTYGAAILGHNRPTALGPYPVTNNPAANRTCAECHDQSIPHIDGTDNTTYSGNRLLATVNGTPTGGTVLALCRACHATAGATPVATPRNRGINTHGNTGFPERLEAVFADRTCNQCHEPHGMVSVTAAPAGVNLWMINPTITVAPGTTVSPVRLFARSGPNSFDNTGTTSDLCRVCHANATNPGYPMTYNVAGQHAAPAYTSDERGKDCSGCHPHNQDDDMATGDGLMPLPCNACHSYPGLDNSASPKQMSAAHGKHAGTPTNTTTNTKGYACTLCHYNYIHNQSRVAKGAAWPANYYDNVDINFDPSWNGVGTTYRGLAVPTTGNGGTGECGGLYCHGASQTLSPAWGGSDNTPVWNQPSTAVCGTCHDTGTADTTPGTVFSTKNHPVHLDNVARPYGPETWRLVGAGNCAEGTGCHTKYGLTPSSPHANNVKSLRSTATDNGEVAATLSTTQVCRNCHTTYTSARITVSGDAQVRTQANWDNPAFYVDCLTCHNGTAAGTQASANLDGSGGVAHAIEVTWYGMQHGIQMGAMCGWCHGDVGHIGARRPVSTDPYRLDGYFFTSYPPLTQQGQIDWACQYCHNMFSGYDHAWRVAGTGTSGPETKAATDTHPTTVLAVGTDKDRWYQVPASTHMPLFGDLLDSSYNRSSGTNNYVLCVTCHDPHGVGTSPVPSAVRRFSGQNNDNNGIKALRFNYSSGTPTALCSQCHK